MQSQSGSTERKSQIIVVKQMIDFLASVRAGRRLNIVAVAAQRERALRRELKRLKKNFSPARIRHLETKTRRRVTPQRRGLNVRPVS